MRVTAMANRVWERGGRIAMRPYQWVPMSTGSVGNELASEGPS
jgi:hypothetical protein